MDMKEKEREAPSPPGLSHFIMIFVFILTIFVIFDPSLRRSAGKAIGGVLEPVIGFDGVYPVITLFLAGLFMIAFSSILRHFFTDWYEVARAQNAMKAYQKELREARMARNQAKLKKLMEMQGEMMEYQSRIMMSQMKSTIFVMIVAISVFAWLYTFVSGLKYPYISLPWEPKWPLMENPYILPNWILIYILISIPIGQLLMRLLKFMEFTLRRPLK